MARTMTRPQATEADHEALGLAPLTDAMISAQTDPNSFNRGRGYAHSKRIFSAVRRENVLRARCHGSSGGPYFVEATLARAGATQRRNPTAFSCDCPRGGLCKHVVALLLTWLESPDAFEVRPPISELLADRSRDELAALVELMLKQAPDLEELLELPALATGTPTADPVDEEAVRRQVAAVLKGVSTPWGYGYGGYDYGATTSTPSMASRSPARSSGWSAWLMPTPMPGTGTMP